MSALARKTPLRRRHKNSTRRRDELRAPSHYQWVGGYSCCVPGCTCQDSTERHHIRKGIPNGDKGGTSEKPHDKWTVPMCGGPDGHHAEYHRIGHDTFEKKYGVDLKAIAARLWQQSPHRRKYET